MMTARFWDLYRFERLIAVLATAAVLLRCVIAPGFMLDPVAAAQGKLTLVICTPAGAKSIAPASDQRPAPHQKDGAEQCPYMSAGHAGPPADPVAFSGEVPSPAFEAPTRDATLGHARILSFAARAPPKFS